MSSFSATGSDAVERTDASPRFGSSADRMVLLTIIQRMTSDWPTELLIAETVELLQSRLGLSEVTISLSNSPAWPLSEPLNDAFWCFALARQQSGESWVEVPVLLNNVAVGFVRGRIANRSDPSLFHDVESYLVLVAALLACHLRTSEVSRWPTLVGQTVKLLDKTWSIQRAMILQALKQTKGNMAAAARHLGITPRIIRYKVRKLGINPHQVG